MHVDGAFGLWARAVDGLRPLADGVERADSWGVDAHKWLNVPYDSGIAIVAHPAAHRASMAQRASYLLRADGERRDGMDWTPEASRRARAVPVYAALKTLGREGVAALVAGNCARARQMAERLRAQPGLTILNDVVLNQVLVRARSRAGENITPAVIARVQDADCDLELVHDGGRHRPIGVVDLRRRGGGGVVHRSRSTATRSAVFPSNPRLTLKNRVGSRS